MRPAYFVGLAVGLFVASFASSFVHPWGNPRSGVDTEAPLLDGSDASASVAQALETKCADCHSENTNWPAYSRLAPASWLIERDVLEGRGHLNMSQWQHYTVEAQIDLLSRIASEARSGEMPLRRYMMLHPQAKLSPEEQQLIYDWSKAERKQLRQQIAAQQAGAEPQ